MIWLDFKHKIAYQADKMRHIVDVPATIDERKAFEKVGKTECTFKELKQYCSFHGSRKKGRVYATIKITNQWDYVRMLNVNNDLNEAIHTILYENKINKKENMSETMKNTLVDFLEEIIKKIK